MGLQAVSLSFKVRITACRCRGHSGMCVVEKEGVGVESQGTPCTGQHWQQDACCSRGRKRATNRTHLGKLRLLHHPRHPKHRYFPRLCTYMFALKILVQSKINGCDCHGKQVHLSLRSLHTIMHHLSLQTILSAPMITHHLTSPACGTFSAARGAPSQTRPLLFRSQASQRGQTKWTARYWRIAPRSGHLAPLRRVRGASGGIDV